MLQEQCSGTGQACAARGADEQCNPEFLFQFLDGPRQRGLLDVQPLGGSGEVKFFSDGEKVAKVAKLHCRHPLRYVSR